MAAARIEDGTVAAGDSNAGTTRSPAPGGQDWCVLFKEEPDGRQWSDALKYGFVSTGGYKWFDRSLQDLTPEFRLFAFIPGAGYVAVGRVLHEATRFDQAQIPLDGEHTALSLLSLDGTYTREGDENDDIAEWVVPVDWTHAVPREHGVFDPRMVTYAKMVTKMRQKFTIDRVAKALGAHK